MTHPSNILMPSVDLLPCPVCGKPAELHKTADGTDEYPDNGCFVVFCQDTHCAGNCAPERSTPDEAIAAWNEQAAHPEFRWHKSCCPNCGWSDADEQGFQQYLEHYQSLPQPPRWKKFLRFVGRWFSVDFYWAFIFFIFLHELDYVLQSQGIESGLTTLHYFMIPAIFLAPVIVCRGLYGLLEHYVQNREFEELFNNTTTTPQPPKGDHHA